jgi:uncharacterized protein YrrD
VTAPGTPIAWSALSHGTPVLTSDGTELGKVSEVVADEQKDIFSGIRVDPGWFRDERFVPADLIDRLTRDAVYLSISADQAKTKLHDNHR